MTKIAIIGGGAAGMYASVFLAEKGHEERYRAFIQNIETASVFAKEGEVVWQCRNCGFMYLKRMKNLEKNYLLRERVGAM